MITPHRVASGMTAFVLAASLSGCASSTEPTSSVYSYPAQGQTPQQQAQDTSACQTWAQQQTGYSPGTDAAKGAGIGLAVGALGGAAAGAAIGAATGAAPRLPERFSGMTISNATSASNIRMCRISAPG